MERVNTIIFDLGGVIITLDQDQAISRFEQLGLSDARERLDAYTQRGIFGDLEHGLITAEDFRRELSQLVGRQLTHEECAHAWQGYAKEVPERNLEALRRLREQGYRLLLLSNTNPYMMEWVESSRFDGHGHPVSHYFDHCYLSYQMRMMKPSEQIFHEVLRQEKTFASECLFVDDGARNVATASQLGMRTLQPVNGENWTKKLGALLMKSIFTILCFLFTITAMAQPKREFRGAWIQCVNGQFRGIGTETMQQTLTYQLDELQRDGCNAIIFQVRPECDALYESRLEPWSYYLTGRQGQAPQPYWDPLAWMVDQCHRRGMELHAWINPYRAKTKTPHASDPRHVTAQHPERCFVYDGLTLLNPALEENRTYICDVVRDILERYDVDGLHIDDYFYPYPVAGVSIPDEADYRANSNGISDRGDWRRYNVNLFIEQLAQTIRQTKPWVKFGVSPFGIYRNQKSDPNGSRTNGLQNYDDLYADVLLWVSNGWIDYCVPQLYWEIGNRAADYDELIRWWNKHCSQVPLFIGEDVERTVKHADPNRSGRHQLQAKMSLHTELPNVKGTVLWYAKAAVDNIGNYGTSLRAQYWRYPALQPRVPRLSGKAVKTPSKVRRAKLVDIGDGQRVLFWTAPKARQWDTEATRYAVYRFRQGETVDIEDASHLVCITADTHYELPAAEPKSRYVYVVTALNRIQNESKPVKMKVKY